MIGARNIMKKALSLILLLMLALPPIAAADTATKGDANIFDVLRQDGHVLLLRHALAPGFGDPADIDLNDCKTQRNISAEGLHQAQSIGDRLRAEGLGNARVYTSYWCRCADTANALGLTPPQRHAGLNSFFQQRQKRDQIVTELGELLGSLADSPPAILVTHQVNIRAITGQGVRSGEGVVVKTHSDGSVTVIGRFVRNQLNL